MVTISIPAHSLKSGDVFDVGAAVSKPALGRGTVLSSVRSPKGRTVTLTVRLESGEERETLLMAVTMLSVDR